MAHRGSRAAEVYLASSSILSGGHAGMNLPAEVLLTDIFHKGEK